MSSYTAFDGVPPGDYVVTVTAGANLVPARYVKPETSELKVAARRAATRSRLS